MGAQHGEINKSLYFNSTTMKFYNWNSFEWKCKFSFALFPFFEAFLYWRYGLLYFTAIFHLIAVKAPLQFSFVWKERDISKAWNIMISNTSSLVCYRVFIIECPKNKLLFLGLIRKIFQTHVWGILLNLQKKKKSLPKYFLWDTL